MIGKPTPPEATSQCVPDQARKIPGTALKAIAFHTVA